MVHAFVLLKAEPAHIASLAAALTEIDGVAEVSSVAGDIDLIAIVRVRHHDDLAEVVTVTFTPAAGGTGTTGGAVGEFGSSALQPRAKPRTKPRVASSCFL